MIQKITTTTTVELKTSIKTKHISATNISMDFGERICLPNTRKTANASTVKQWELKCRLKVKNTSNYL